VKRLWLVVLMVILPFAASARLAVAVEDKEEGLPGTWLPLSAELGKQKLPDATLKIMKLVLTDKTYAVHVADDVDKGTVKLDTSKTPKAMDITGTEGPNKGKTMLAIYELKGDTLRVCYDLKGKARPTEFNANAGQTPLFLVTYRREKP
jgi:uncharacterized protein (TIGR03067 family)